MLAHTLKYFNINHLSMDFFFLKESADLKIVGKYPQLEKMFDGFHGQYRYEAWGLFNSRTTVPMKKATGFELKYHAKMTDWVSFVQVGADAALISERLYDLLCAFDPMPFISVDAEVGHRKKIYPYKFLCFTERYDHFIDFKRSRFFIGFASNWEKDVVINSFEEYSLAQASLEEERTRTGKITRVNLIDLFIDLNKANKDLFKFQFRPELIVSARLKEAIEKSGITGLKFEPAQGYKFHVLDYSVNPPRQII